MENIKNTFAFNNSYHIFAVSVFDIHIIRFAIESISKKVLKTNNNTPPMPLSEAHLGGFFSYKKHTKWQKLSTIKFRLLMKNK